MLLWELQRNSVMLHKSHLRPRVRFSSTFLFWRSFKITEIP